MKYIHTKLLALLICFSAGNLLVAQSTGGITGSVKSQYGSNLEAVLITLRNTDKGTISSEDGKFTMSNVTPGTYTLEVSSVGYEPASRRVTIIANKVVRVSFALEESLTSLGEIYVKGESLKPENSTITVDMIGLQQIRTLNIEQPLRLIEQVPGVDLVAFRQGGVADQFSIRGFGGGGHEGQAGVQIDGVSLNEAEGHSDGYADMNILIPINLKKVQVYKGPSSVLFGRFAQGGTLAIETRKGGTYQDVSISAGSFNTFDAQFALGRGIPLGLSDKKIETNLAFQLFQTDGYSENSQTLRGNVSGRLSYDISDRTDISLSLRGHSSRWNAPGYISEDQFNDEDRRNLQDVNAEDDGGEKQFYSQRIDLNHTFNENLRLLLFGYSVQQEFTRLAKFGYQPGGQSERFNTRNVYASGGSLNGNTNIGSVNFNWIAGLEYYSEQTERLRWDTSDRVRQQQTQDRLFTIQSVSSYAQGEFEVSPYFRPSIGLRFDSFYGSFEGKDPNQTPIEDQIDGLSNVAPKVGFRTRIFEGFDIRVNASNGFSIPNSALKYEEDLDLGPINLWQYELGASYLPINWLELDVVGFILNSSNEIFENPPGSLEFRNAGATRRTGIESKASINPVEGLTIQGTFSYIETEIMDNPEANLEGNELANIPQTISTFDISYATKSGLGVRYRLRDVGEYFISPDNLASYEGYTVSHLSLFYNYAKQSAYMGRIFIEVQNLFDARYAEAVWGDATARNFAPAPTRNFTVGVSYNF